MSQIFSTLTINLYATFFCVFILLGSAPQAYAQNKFDKLTDGNIRFFIEDLSNITAGSDANNNQDRIAAFLNRHLHPSARFKSILEYNIPGMPAQANSVALDKEEFIENINAGTQVLENYENETHIIEIKISSDKRKATIQTQGIERGTMRAEEQDIPVQGNSTCHQIVMLSKKGVIQMYNANCQTIISFQDY